MASTLFAATGSATDFNADYKHGCTSDFGGIALSIDGVFTPTGVYAGNPYRSYVHAAQSCTSLNFTLISWACDRTNTGSTGPCIPKDTPIHIGFSSGLMSNTVNNAYVYKYASQTCEYAQTLNLDPMSCVTTGYDDECPAVRLPEPPGPAPARIAAANLRFHAMSVISWNVHADGKTLTVINGRTFPAQPCPQPVYVGNIRFQYYAARQPLSTLNSDSLGQPLAVIGLEDRPSVPCDDSVTVSVFSNPPDAASFLVVSAIEDTVPSLDSPGAAHVWIQEAIVREGQFALGTEAGPNGHIVPGGPVVVSSGATQAFTVAPNAGYRVADVLVDGVSVGAVATYTFTNVTADHRISARFAAIEPPDCGHVAATPSQLWPPNHKMVKVKLAGMRDGVAAKIVRVTQDEPSEEGDDVVLDGTDGCQLRAERDGAGNGRVYTLWYTATDDAGGECEGSVQVCVPHDKAHSQCIDDGPIEDGSGRHVHGRRALKGRLALRSTVFQGRQAVVEYSLPATGVVHLALYDIAGRRVADIENEVRGEGMHQATWDATHLSSGMYFYRLRTDSETITKAVLIR